MKQIRGIARLVMAVGFETGALVGLVHLGRRPWLHIQWSELGRWLRVTPTEDALAAMIWLLTLGCVIWLAGSSLIYIAARASRAPAVLLSVQWMTLPALRRVTDRALGAFLVASTVAATPVRADPPPPVIVVVDAEGTLLPPGIVGRLPETPMDRVGPIDSTVPPQPALPYEIPAAEGRPAVVTVRAGDNLWVLCRRHLSAVLGRRPTNEVIARYWRSVIAHNQPNLISGDPDLIYAGEVIEMLPTG